tara:strand:+ start:1524 stop:1718 length:195 start_codon:yes stop_codon:yes gene_type:complete
LISIFIVVSGVLIRGFMNGGAVLITLVKPSGLTKIEGEFVFVGFIIGDSPVITKRIRKKIIIVE